MDTIDYPHLTDQPTWHITFIDGGWRYGANLVPIHRGLHALDDKIRVLLAPEIELMRYATTECIPSPSGRLSRSMDITGMFADMPSTMGIQIVRALITTRLGISYINLMPKAHGRRSMRMYNRCGTGNCINIEHHKFNRARHATTQVKVMDLIEAGPPLAVSVETNEFYTAFHKVFNAWVAELESTQGEASWHTELNKRVAAWLAERQDIAREHRATDLLHPVSVMELEGLDLSPEVETYFIRKTPELKDDRVDTDYILGILKRD